MKKDLYTFENHERGISIFWLLTPTLLFIAFAITEMIAIIHISAEESVALSTVYPILAFFTLAFVPSKKVKRASLSVILGYPVVFAFGGLVLLIGWLFGFL